jgi:hypothetical protein
MIFTYLFEAKSIQAYLFKTGKLKDVIAASERLDNLIDDTETSLLSQVITSCELSSDLINPVQVNSNELIRFIRVKGGAFYAYCATEAPLLQLRSTWTLMLQQLFPSLEFTDALTKGERLQKAIQRGHKKLAEDRNTPLIHFPLTSAISERCPRTGSASVPISALASKASYFDDNEQTMDIDTELHRQAYQALGMKNKAALQDKFTPQELINKVKYPADLEKDFQHASKSSTSNKDAIKDMAIIHIDGNGLGLILRKLQQSLENASDDQYRETFRQFSGALSDATQTAAQHATQWLYDFALTEEEKKAKTFIPMRPIVLGGDDITLLCRADLALEYSKRFCKAFKVSSEQALKTIFSKLKADINTKPYLTASGGILYNKAGHPLTHSHHLVEGLCATAKALTKKVDQDTGPAALAFFRLSNAVSTDVQQLIKQSQCFLLDDSQQNLQINLGLNRYLVERDDSGEVCFDDLEACVALSNKEDAPISMSKWRNIATQLALGNQSEADRLYHRALDISGSNKRPGQTASQQRALQTLSNDAADGVQWYWTREDGQLQTVIADLLIVNHFACSSSDAKDQVQETMV